MRRGAVNARAGRAATGVDHTIDHGASPCVNERRKRVGKGSGEREDGESVEGTRRRDDTQKSQFPNASRRGLAVSESRELGITALTPKKITPVVGCAYLPTFDESSRVGGRA